MSMQSEEAQLLPRLTFALLELLRVVAGLAYVNGVRAKDIVSSPDPVFILTRKRIVVTRLKIDISNLGAERIIKQLV